MLTEPETCHHQQGQYTFGSAVKILVYDVGVGLLVRLRIKTKSRIVKLRKKLSSDLSSFGNKFYSLSMGCF